PFFQFIETDTFARVSWNFTDAHTEGFDDLKNPKECRRFDCNDVAGIGDSAQAKVDGFSSSDSGDDIVGSKQATGFERATGDLNTKCAASGRRIIGMGLDRRTSADGGHHASEFFEREKFSAG